MKFLSTLFSLLFLISCGESPLFNHENEASIKERSVLLSEMESLNFSKLNRSFVISWVDGPQLGASSFILKTWVKDVGTESGPYENLSNTLHIFLWMPSMGHGSVPVKINQIAEGEYEVSNVQFIMGGNWEIKFQVKNGNQVLDEVVYPLSL